MFSFFLCHLSAQISNPLQINLAVLDQAHDEIFGRPAEHAFYEVADGLAEDGLPGGNRAIDIGTPHQRALDSPLAMENVQHGLHRVVGKIILGRQALLHLQNIAWSFGPKDLHDLQFERGKGGWNLFCDRP